MAYIQGLVDKEGNSIYPPTVAQAVYVQTKDGTTQKQQKLSDKLAEMDSTVSDMKSSFTDGVDTLVSKLKELGITPSENSPSGIAQAIQDLADTYYNSGYKTANETVTTTSASYIAGVTQGHNDVISNPGDYGLITEDDLETYGTERYNAGYAAGKTAVSGTVSTNCSFYRDNEGGDGVRARVNGSANATATITNGTLKISISASGTGTGWRSIDGGWVNELSASASGSNNASKQIA